jgi:transcriptional regulator with XRE-family HTH domain
MRKAALTREEIRASKLLLYEKLRTGEITIGQATRMMRNIAGLTQKEYAAKVLGIFPRVLMDLEKDRGNPTLETLEKVAKPFGLKIGFVRPVPRTHSVSGNDNISATD